MLIARNDDGNDQLPDRFMFPYGAKIKVLESECTVLSVI